MKVCAVRCIWKGEQNVTMKCRTSAIAMLVCRLCALTARHISGNNIPVNIQMRLRRNVRQCDAWCDCTKNERNRRNEGNIGVSFTPWNIMRKFKASVCEGKQAFAQYRTNGSFMCKISLQFVPQNGCTTHSHPKTQLLRANCNGLFFSSWPTNDNNLCVRIT